MKRVYLLFLLLPLLSKAQLKPEDVIGQYKWDVDTTWIKLTFKENGIFQSATFPPYHVATIDCYGEWELKNGIIVIQINSCYENEEDKDLPGTPFVERYILQDNCLRKVSRPDIKYCKQK